MPTAQPAGMKPSRVRGALAQFGACLLVILGLLASAPETARGQAILKDVGEDTRRRALLLPYAFWTDSTKFLVGGVYATTIPDQPWTSAFITAFASTNGTVPLYGGAFDIQVFPRLFVDPRGHAGRWDQARAYNVLFPTFDPRPGSNDSDEDAFIDDSSLEWWLEIPFHYTLPMGGFADDPIAVYELQDGLLATGPDSAVSWNPLESGRTQILLEFFARQQHFEVDDIDQSFKTLGVEFGLEWDNRDFANNPSRGSRWQVNVARDPGWFSSSDSWTTWDLEISKYFDLGEDGWFRQKVVALDFWTGDTPSWDETTRPDGRRAVDHRPPHFRGSRLGGFYRLRAFPTDRFNDKAAIYYTAELRLIPRWHPIKRIKFIIEAEVDWIQFVPFVEVGRVARTWSFSELHSDMKWDVGLDLRALVEKAVVRMGVAVGEEGFGIRAMVSHPF